MNRLKIILFVAALFSGFAGLRPLMADTGSLVDATEVLIEEQEFGYPSYTSRILVAGDILRLDDGEDEGDYLLFNRKTGRIDSFSHETRSHLVIEPLSNSSIDFDINYRVEKQTLDDAPLINNRVPVQYRYFADDKLCRTSINMPGLLKPVGNMLLAYETTLTRQNARAVEQIPASLKTGCYMANHYLYATNYLENGFPLSVSDEGGRSKKLLGFDDVKVPLLLFEPVEGYQVYSPISFSAEQ